MQVGYCVEEFKTHIRTQWYTTNRASINCSTSVDWVGGLALPVPADAHLFHDSLAQYAPVLFTSVAVFSGNRESLMLDSFAESNGSRKILLEVLCGAW